MPFFAAQDKTKLYYEEQGEGRPVLLVHGWSGSHESMVSVVDRLKDHCRCITYAHRGHGVSDRPTRGYTIQQLARDLHELIEYLDLHDLLLAGHSMGGQVVLSYVEQFGCGRLSKLMIWDMSPRIITDESWKNGIGGSYCQQEFMQDLHVMAQDMGEHLWNFKRKNNPEVAALPESAKDLVVPGLLHMNCAQALMGLWVSMGATDLRGAVEKITVPMGYIYPGNGIYPYGTAEFYREHAAAPVRIFTVEQSPHSVQLYRPTETAQAVLNMLGE